MKITRISPITGNENVMEMDITDEEIQNFHSGMLIQNAFPRTNEDEREFFLSGLLPEEFDEIFGNEEDDEFEDYVEYDFDDDDVAF